MLGKLWNKHSVLKRCLLSTLILVITLFMGIREVSAAQVAPVTAFPLNGDSSQFKWETVYGIQVATTKEELMQQYVEKISRIPEDQSTFTIRLTATKDIYDWAVNKAVNYNSLPVQGNPVLQNSYHIFRIRPRPYYAGSNVRKFDLLISV